MLRALTIAMTSRPTPCRPASSTIRPSRGSIGSRVSCRPDFVMRPSLSTARRLTEQVEAVLHAPAVRRLQERERLDVPEAERDHLQDDRGEVRAEDLGVGVLGASAEVVLGVEPDRDAGTGAARSTGTLAGAGLRDRLDRQALHLGPRGVPRDACRARVDHVLDAGHGQRGLGDVRGEDDTTAGARGVPALEDPVLVGSGQAAVQRQDLGARVALALDRVLRVADLVLAGQEHEHVARVLLRQLVEGVGDALQGVAVVGGVAAVTGAGVRLVVGVVVLVFGDEGAVPDLDRVGAAGHLDDGGVVEVLRERLRVDRRTRDDELQVGATGSNRFR